MKKKTSTKKKPLAKKKSTKKAIDALVAGPTIVIRQITESPTKLGSRHIVRVVEKCQPSYKTFLTIEELNNFLFEFEFANFGKKSIETGTWVDAIITHIEGTLFDEDDLGSPWYENEKK